MTIPLFVELLGTKGVPPVVYGTIAAVGSRAGDGTFSDGTSTLSFTAANVGDAVYVGVRASPDTATIIGIATSGTGVIGSWTKLAGAIGTSSASDLEIWRGIVTTTGACTITATYTATTTGAMLAQEFSTTTGSWGVDGGQSNTSEPASTTYHMPSLTPSGPKRLYLGLLSANTPISTVTSSGYTLAIATDYTAFVYNPSCAPSAQAPQGALSTNQAYDGLSILIQAH